MSTLPAYLGSEAHQTSETKNPGLGFHWANGFGEENFFGGIGNNLTRAKAFGGKF